MLETEFQAFPQGPQMDQGHHGLPPNLLELLTAMTARLNEQDQLVGGPPRTSDLQPPVFHGSSNEDFDEWLETFHRYATFNEWTPEQTNNGFMMFLGGTALRYLTMTCSSCEGEYLWRHPSLSVWEEILRM